MKAIGVYGSAPVLHQKVTLVALRTVGRRVIAAVRVDSQSWKNALSVLEYVPSDAGLTGARLTVVSRTQNADRAAPALTGIVPLNALRTHRTSRSPAVRYINTNNNALSPQKGVSGIAVSAQPLRIDILTQRVSQGAPARRSYVVSVCAVETSV